VEKISPHVRDKRGCGWIVRFVPIATDAPQQTAALFDPLIGGMRKQKDRRAAVSPKSRTLLSLF
jgi:hypothetical protein